MLLFKYNQLSFFQILDYLLNDLNFFKINSEYLSKNKDSMLFIFMKMNKEKRPWLYAILDWLFVKSSLDNEAVNDNSVSALIMSRFMIHVMLILKNLIVAS